jgi:hypothetical protein
MAESTGPVEPAQSGVPDEQPEITLRARVAFCAITWAFALILTLLIVFPAPVGVVFLPSFPEGLFVFLPGRQAMVVGWATYLILTTFLLRSRTRSRYFVLFAVLCALLAVNIPGCKHIADNTHVPHSI